MQQKLKVYDSEILQLNQKNKELEVEVDDLRHQIATLMSSSN